MYSLHFRGAQSWSLSEDGLRHKNTLIYPEEKGTRDIQIIGTKLHGVTTQIIFLIFTTTKTSNLIYE